LNNVRSTPFISRVTTYDEFIGEELLCNNNKFKLLRALYSADFEKCKRLKKKLTISIKDYINWSNNIIAEVASQSWTSGTHISCCATWTWSSCHGSCPMPHHEITIKS
jgi:hypothetical protein